MSMNGNGGALAVRNGGNDFKSLLQSEGVKSAIARALPRHVKVEKIISAALTAVQLNPKLLDCDRTSVLRSIVIASALGLEPGGALGSAYLVPYGKTCTLIPGYRGLIDLARRSGSVKAVEARVVYDCDEFVYEYGTTTKVKHIPRLDRPESARMIAAYCVVTLSDGMPVIEVMSAKEIEAVRGRSRSANNGPWVTDHDEMARKTVVRRALKYAPLSTELANAVALDDRAEGETDQGAGIIDLAPEELEAPPTTADTVRGRLAAVPKPGSDSGPQDSAS